MLNYNTSEKRIATLVLILMLLFFAQGVWAIGAGVKPNKIDINIKTGQETETQIIVINVDSQPAQYQVYSDEFQDQIKINPEDFQLNPNATQIVKINLKAAIPSQFTTNLSIVARPLQAGGLSAASGVKVPISITVSGIPLWWLVLGGLIVFIILLIIILIKKIKK